MARGRNNNSSASTRQADPVQDPLGFKIWWEQLTNNQRLDYVWPSNLDYASLSDLDLRQCDLGHRSLFGVDLTKADLRGAILDGSDLRSAELDRTKVDETTSFKAAQVDEDALLRLEGKYLPDPDEITTSKDGAVLHTWHLPDGAKRIKRFYPDTTQIDYDVYFNADKRYHRLDGPAYQKWFPNGQLQEVVYWINGACHRPCDQGPAFESWWDNGARHQEQYLEQNKLHNEFGAASNSWHKSGKIKETLYHINGDLHSTIGPARLQYNEAGVVTTEEYYRRGSAHRQFGPAKILRDENGHATLEEYWERGQELEF